MRARSFSHTGITVSNFNKAVQFYWDVFGCPLVGVADTPPDRVRTFFGVAGEMPRCKIGWIRVPGGATLEIFEFQPQLPPDAIPWQRVGLTHISFNVRNTQRWYDYLVSKGVECVSRPERSPRGHTFFFAKDFDGNLIEMMDLGYMYPVLRWLGPLGGWLFRRGMYKHTTCPIAREDRPQSAQSSQSDVGVFLGGLCGQHELIENGVLVLFALGPLMPRYIAFLRAINVGGHTVTMEELRRLFDALGFDDVETFIASGNVIFTSRSKNVVALQRRIEDHLRAALGYDVKTFIRSESELAAIAQYTPFDAPQIEAASALNVAFLEAPLDAQTVTSLMALTTDIDDFHVHGREVYWLCKKKQSESTFSNMRFEKALKVRATFRGANTIARLAAKCAQRSSARSVRL